MRLVPPLNEGRWRSPRRHRVELPDGQATLFGASTKRRGVRPRATRCPPHVPGEDFTFASHRIEGRGVCHGLCVDTRVRPATADWPVAHRRAHTKAVGVRAPRLTIGLVRCPVEFEAPGCSFKRSTKARRLVHHPATHATYRVQTGQTIRGSYHAQRRAVGLFTPATRGSRTLVVRPLVHNLRTADMAVASAPIDLTNHQHGAHAERLIMAQQVAWRSGSQTLNEGRRRSPAGVHVASISPSQLAILARARSTKAGAFTDGDTIRGQSHINVPIPVVPLNESLADGVHPERQGRAVGGRPQAIRVSSARIASTKAGAKHYPATRCG